MNSLRLTIGKVFKGAGKSFYRFPTSIISAIVISIVAIIKITMGWEIQQRYNILFDSIQYSFLLAAVFSMATVSLEEIRTDKRKSSFVGANISGIVLALISFLLLYFLGGKISEDKIVYLSNLASARVSVAIFISIVTFIYIVSKAKLVDSFSDSLFIVQKSFIISVIYGLVIMLGVSGVLGAFESLVYKNMDYRIYQYLAVAVSFLTYTIFLGYFPSFTGIENKEEIKEAKEQPRFIYVLLEYILIPILMALTVVLLIWSLRVVFKGVNVSFNSLSTIASSYVIIGIWLHMMVSKHGTDLSRFYKKVYPFAGILILIFEAWALFLQLNKFGLKTGEYSFLMIWIFAIVSVILLFFLKDRAYRKIAITAIVVSIIWVLPFVGYKDITFTSQVNRLEKTLTNQEILIDNSIVASKKEIEVIKRGEITDAVDFISSSEKSNTPLWFKKNLNNEEVFKDSFGFEKTYQVHPDFSEESNTNYRLKTEVIDISGYDLSLNMNRDEGTDKFKLFDGKYEIEILNETSGIPRIIVKSGYKIIIKKDMEKYLTNLSKKYLRGENGEVQVPFEDMNLILEDEDISILFVFDNIDNYSNERNNETNYYINLYGIYIKNK